jgi:hypothetical protein
VEVEAMSAIRTILELNDQYQKQLRKQMKEHDKRRFRDPDQHDPLKRLYVIYVWRDQWLLAGFARAKPTPKRVLRWRKRLHVSPRELARIVELKLARQVGAGGPPRMTDVPAPKKKRKAKPVPVPVPPRRKERVDPSLSTCDYGKGLARRARCTHRAAWHVSYKTLRSVGRPVLKCRCTKHAWHAKYFPEVARDLVRVKRQVVKSKKKQVRR